MINLREFRKINNINSKQYFCLPSRNVSVLNNIYEVSLLRNPTEIVFNLTFNNSVETLLLVKPISPNIQPPFRQFLPIPQEIVNNLHYSEIEFGYWRLLISIECFSFTLATEEFHLAKQVNKEEKERIKEKLKNQKFLKKYEDILKAYSNEQ